MRPLKVALESTVLLSSDKGALHKKGIYRYSYNLAEALLKQKDLSLDFIHRFDSFSSNYDIIHIPTLSSHFMGVPSSFKKLSKTQIIVTVHDLITWLFPEKINPHFHKYKQTLSLESSNWVVCPSEHTKTDLIQHFNFPKDQIFVTPLYINEKLFYRNLDHSVLQKYLIPNQPYLIYVGRIEDRKGVELLIESFKTFILDQKIDDLNLVLVGTLTSKQIQYCYIKEIVEAKLEKRVIHILFAEDEDLKTLYSHAEAHCFFSEYEGFGYPLLEAMRCKTPSICFKNSSIPEVVGDSAFFIEDRSIESVCQTFIKFFKDKKLREEKIEKGFERSFLFNQKQFTEKMLVAYHHIANKCTFLL